MQTGAFNQTCACRPGSCCIMWHSTCCRGGRIMWQSQEDQGSRPRCAPGATVTACAAADPVALPRCLPAISPWIPLPPRVLPSELSLSGAAMHENRRWWCALAVVLVLVAGARAGCPFGFSGGLEDAEGGVKGAGRRLQQVCRFLPGKGPRCQIRSEQPRAVLWWGLRASSGGIRSNAAAHRRCPSTAGRLQH